MAATLDDHIQNKRPRDIKFRRKVGNYDINKSLNFELVGKKLKLEK